MDKKRESALDAAAGLMACKVLYRGTDREERIAEKERQLESQLQEVSPEFAEDTLSAMGDVARTLGGGWLAPIWRA